MKKILIIILLLTILVATFVSEGHVQQHVVFGIEATPYFSAWFGFLTSVVIIFVSKFLGIFLKRKEDYYKDGAGDDR